MPKYTFTFFEEGKMTMGTCSPILCRFIQSELNILKFTIFSVTIDYIEGGTSLECVFECPIPLAITDTVFREYHGDKPQYYSAIVDSSGVASCFGKGHMLDIAIAITKLRFLATAPDHHDYEYAWENLVCGNDPEYRLLHGREDR